MLAEGGFCRNHGDADGSRQPGTGESGFGINCLQPLVAWNLAVAMAFIYWRWCWARTRVCVLGFGTSHVVCVGG